MKSLFFKANFFVVLETPLSLLFKDIFSTVIYYLSLNAQVSLCCCTIPFLHKRTAVFPILLKLSLYSRLPVLSSPLECPPRSMLMPLLLSSPFSLRLTITGLSMWLFHWTTLSVAYHKTLWSFISSHHTDCLRSHWYQLPPSLYSLIFLGTAHTRGWSYFTDHHFSVSFLSLQL